MTDHYRALWDLAVADRDRYKGLLYDAWRTICGQQKGLKRQARRIKALRARVAELERDADRLGALVWPECVVDGIGSIDLHEEAAIYASAFGREEPNKDDYLAALRTAIDAAMREGKG